MSITTVGNHLIHYEVLGRGHPVIFLHSWLGSWRYWWPSMQALAAHHRAFSLDLWGYGDSSKNNDRYSLDDYVEMIDHFRDKLGIMQPAHLVGHGLGAAVALHYARKKPEDVDKIVTVALPLTKNHLNARLTNSDPDTILNRVLGKSNSFSEVDSELRKIDPKAMNQMATELAGLDLGNEVARLTRPILLVYGSQDIITPPPGNEVYYLQRPGSSRYFVLLETCNHFPMLQEKIKFNRLLLDFLLTDDADITDIAPKEYWQRRVR